MWGCIAGLSIIYCPSQVPSLYVRVYRIWLMQEKFYESSLIICEGVSLNLSFMKNIAEFPHYMWGCIAKVDGKMPYPVVPSLYVRVYPEAAGAAASDNSSLIICEGVSHFSEDKNRDMVFPHYMWGCIAIAKGKEELEAVPSLYVRVYRSFAVNITGTGGSLIICEGVSKKIS